MSSSKVSAALTRLREIDQKYRTRKVEDDTSSESSYNLQMVEKKNVRENKMDIKIPMPVESVSASESQRSEKVSKKSLTKCSDSEIKSNNVSTRKSEKQSESVNKSEIQSLQSLNNAQTLDSAESIEEEIESKSSLAGSVSEMIKNEDYDETFESESQISETTDISQKWREKSEDSTFSNSQSSGKSKRIETDESTGKSDNISKSEQIIQNQISESKSSRESQKSSVKFEIASSENSYKTSNLSRISNKSEQSLKNNQICEKNSTNDLISAGQNTEVESSLKSNINTDVSSEKKSNKSDTESEEFVDLLKIKNALEKVSEKGKEKNGSAENNLSLIKSEKEETNYEHRKSISDRKSIRSKSEKEEEPSKVCMKESLKPLMSRRDKLNGPGEAGRQTRKAGQARRNKRFFAKKHIRKINLMQEREELKMMKNAVAKNTAIQPLEFPYFSSFILPDEIETVFTRGLSTERHLHLQRKLLDIKQWLESHLQVYHRQCRMAKEIDSSYCPTTFNDTRKMIHKIRRTIYAR